MKGSGKPDDRKGHVRFDAAGAGDGFTVELVRHRQTKGTVTDRLHLRNTAPVLDPTAKTKGEGVNHGENHRFGSVPSIRPPFGLRHRWGRSAMI